VTHILEMSVPEEQTVTVWTAHATLWDTDKQVEWDEFIGVYGSEEEAYQASRDYKCGYGQVLERFEREHVVRISKTPVDPNGNGGGVGEDAGGNRGAPSGCR